jgi:hypothetical protein
LPGFSALSIAVIRLAPYGAFRNDFRNKNAPDQGAFAAGLAEAQKKLIGTLNPF